MGVKLKFEIGEQVWCIYHDKIQMFYISSITVSFSQIQYNLAETEKDVEEEENIGQFYYEDTLFVTKAALIGSL